jgi:hypothetical protein
MKNILIFFLFTSFSLSHLSSQVVFNYGNTSNSISFLKSISDNNCGLFVSGFSKERAKYFIIHFNENGDTIWNKEYNFEPFAPTFYNFQHIPFTDITMGDDGIYFSCGTFNNPQTSSNYFALFSKIDFTGNLVWTKIQEDVTLYLQPAVKYFDNRIFLTTASLSGDTLRVSKFDSNGTCLLKKSITSNELLFIGPSIVDISIVDENNICITGRLSYYNSPQYLGFYSIRLDSLLNIVNTFRIYPKPFNKPFGIFDAFVKENGDSYFCSVSGPNNKHGIRVHKKLNNSSLLLSKTLYNQDRIFCNSFHLANENLILIGGYLIDSLNKQYGFQTSVDTNFNIISSRRYSSNEFGTKTSLNQNITSCNSVFSLGNVTRDTSSHGLIIKQQYISDNTCNQEDFALFDSLNVDSIAPFNLSVHESSGWININASNSNFLLTKNLCLESVGINKLLQNDDIVVYPNPAENKIKLNFTARNRKIIQIVIYDIIGQQIFSTSNVSGIINIEINTTDFKNGIYLISLLEDENNVVNKKFQVQH